MKDLKRGWSFDGIRLCKVSNVFYTFVGDVLYKYPVYKKNNQGWLVSDYWGYEKNHEKWKLVTSEQDKKHRLSLQLKKINRSIK